MKYFLTGLSLLMLLLASCKDCKDCKVDPIRGTRETKDKPYSGDPNKKVPHYKTVRVTTLEHDCAKQGCTYSAVARVMLHNPTDKKVEADALCRFTLGDGYEFGLNKRDGIVVQPKSSKGAELQQMVSVEPAKRDTIGANCEVAFR